MPHKLRKIRKKRGSRTQGYGRVGQHRGIGSRGKRNAGKHKHLWSYVIKYEPDHFGKKGFTSPFRRKEKIINVEELDEIAEKISFKKEKGKFYINLSDLGYTKLLGTGKITKPLIVTVLSCSNSTIEKIKKAGGRILIKPHE